MENKIDLRITILGLVIYQRTKQLNLKKLQRKMMHFPVQNQGVVDTHVQVTPDSVGFIIGSKGATVNLIKRNTGAWVQVNKGASPPSFHVRGFPHQVDEAVKWIQTIVSEAASRGPPPAHQHQPPAMNTSAWPSLSTANFQGSAPKTQHVAPAQPQQTQYRTPMPSFVPTLGPNQVWMYDHHGVPFIYTIPSNVDRSESEAKHREDVRAQEEMLQRDHGYLAACEFTGADEESVMEEYEFETERENQRMGFDGTDWSKDEVWGSPPAAGADWSGYEWGSVNREDLGKGC